MGRLILLLGSGGRDALENARQTVLSGPISIPKVKANIKIELTDCPSSLLSQLDLLMDPRGERARVTGLINEALMTGRIS